jgi:Domain of unknown function (DUF6538)
MIIVMSRPWRHPDTGVFYFRSRLPADLKKVVAGRSLTVDVEGAGSTVKLADTLKISLRTKDEGEARLRHASVQAQVQQRWAAARTGATSLSNREILALAGEWYRDLVRTHEDDPGDPDDWAIYQDLLGDGLQYFQLEDSPKQGVRVLSRQFNIDAFLEARGLNLDEPTRTKLVGQVAIALILGAETLKRRGHGDYGPDETVKRFPQWRSSKSLPAAGGVSLTALLDGWAKETKPVQSTLDLRKTYVAMFIAFIGHDDAHSVQRPDIVRWKNHLVELGNATKTINDGKLAALKAIFRWGVDNDLLPSNSATGVSVKRSRKSGEKMLGFGSACMQYHPRRRYPLCGADRPPRHAHPTGHRGVAPSGGWDLLPWTPPARSLRPRPFRGQKRAG